MKYIFFIILQILLLSNCNSAKAINAKQKRQPNPEGTYMVTHLFGEKISLQNVTITFNKESTSISGFSGCNNYSCNYTSDLKKISFKFPIATKRMCAETVKIERDFFNVLSESKSHVLQKTSLVFFDENTEIILKAEKKQ